MRTFPLEDKNNIVTEICEQLRDLMELGEGGVFTRSILLQVNFCY